MAECVYQGQYEAVPSILPCKCQDQFMTELHKELGQCLLRAQLQSAMETAQSLCRGRKHFQAPSSSHNRSPSAEGRRKEISKR